MKSLAEQDQAALGGAGSVLARQKQDHVRLDRLLHRLGETRGSHQALVLLDVYRLVFPHAFAEETVLWPVIRRVLPDGHELTLRVEVEHQQVNELVTGLEALGNSDPGREEVLDRLVRTLRQDVRDEENELLPRLQAKLSPAQLRRLGLAWETVRRVAPTRAHPIVSRRPPGNVLAALPLSLLDRCRDRVEARLHRGRAGAAPGLRALHQALGSASGAVERLPGLRRGEDPATRLNARSHAGWAAAAAMTLVGLWAIGRLTRRRRRAADATVPRGHRRAASRQDVRFSRPAPEELSQQKRVQHEPSRSRGPAR